ncbi:flippase [Butyrivibrio sp. LB2008]|uniref:flippase n=1 Tax=Butyrivibrio sp. LB2008 TaxID=1408305 RepID=UPI00047DEAE6|nr:flippase [Butyrivibrio sp. LB2008]
MTTKETIKSNFIFNALYQLSGIIIPLITLPYVTRVLHAQGLGEYSYAYSVAYYFYIFIRLGLHNYGNRTIAYVKDDTDKLSKVFFELYSFQFSLGVIMTVLYLVYCIFLSPNKSLSFIFTAVVLAGGIDITWALYGLEEFKITSIRDILTKIITSICIFIFVKDGADVWKYSLIYSVGFFISQAVSLPVLSKKVKFIMPSFAGVQSHIKPNLILFLPTVAVSLYKTMDKIMLGIMSNSDELGYYHSSEKIIMVPMAFITALGTVMLPRMSNMLSNDVNEKQIRTVFDKSITFAMFLSTALCMGIMTVSKEFVILYFGEGFEKCELLFLIILPSCLFLAFANVIRTQYLLPRKKDKLFIISLFSGAAVNVFLNATLIPRYASVGAAIGTLVAEMVVCVVQVAYVYKEANIGQNILNSLPFIFAGMVMFFLCKNYVLPIENSVVALLIKILLSGAIYLMVLGVSILIKKFLVRND